MRNLDAIIRVSNYIRPNPGLQRVRPLWSGASDKLIMHFLPAKKIFMLLSQSCKMAEGNSSSRTPCERAVILLRVVQNLLEQSNEVSVTGTSNGPHQGSSVRQGVQNVSNSGSSQPNSDSLRQNNDSNRQELIIQNFRNLFAGYSASSRN